LLAWQSIWSHRGKAKTCGSHLTAIERAGGHDRLMTTRAQLGANGQERV
jgi:hypothetical protein